MVAEPVNGYEPLIHTGMAASAGVSLDTRSLGKLANFSGKDEDWPLWSWRAESWLSLIPQADPGWENSELLEQSAARAGPIDLAAMPPSVQEYGKIVYLFLSQVLEGKALQKARSVPRGHGLELWRLMKQDNEGANGGRGTAVLIGLLTPTFEQECVSRPFLEVLADWEVRVQRYEEQTGEVVSGAQRVAVLARWAPAARRAVVRQSR